jgi:hypothetical protein
METRRVISLLSILMEVLWVYPWYAWISRWDVLEWPQPPMALGSAVALALAAEVMSHLSLARGWTPVRTLLLVLPALAALLALLLRLDLSGRYTLWDPDWARYAGDHTSLLLGGLALGAYLLWRGISVGRDSPSFDDLYRKLQMGLTALVLLLIVVSITGASEIRQVLASTGFYVLGFFAAGLMALGLANFQSIQEEMLRREGTPGVLSQRWVSMLMGVVFAIVAIALIVASAFSFSLATLLLRPLGVLANWLYTALVYTVAFPLGVVAAVLAYVLRFLASLVGRGDPPDSFSAPTPVEVRRVMEGQETGGIPPEAVLALKWGLLALVVMLVLLILASSLLKYWKAKDEEGVEEVSESLWSWEGFKADLRSFLSRLLSRFKRRERSTAMPASSPLMLEQEDQAGGFTVREMYQRLLHEGRRAGLPRRHPETPHEYRGRLQASFGPAELELQAITEAYTAERYGRAATPDEQLGLLNHLWRRLRSVLRGQ